MSYEATGRIIDIGPVRQVGTVKTYEKREVVIELGDRYPQQVQFELFDSAVPKLDGCQVGDTVTLHFDLRGRPYTGKDGVTRHYNKLNVWRVERVSADAPTPHTGAAGVDDDLPF